MTPTAGATALPAGTRIALASGKQQPIEKLAPGAILAGDAVVTAVDRLPGGSVTGAVLLAPGAIAPASPAAPGAAGPGGAPAGAPGAAAPPPGMTAESAWQNAEKDRLGGNSDLALKE